MSMKKIGILGSGTVGQKLGEGFAKAGYNVKLGTRNPDKLEAWQKNAGSNAFIGSFEEAAKFGEMIFLCTKWAGTENAINMAGKNSFSRKIVVDVTNPLLFEKEGEMPKMALAYPESGGKAVQRWLPETKVVKCFNTVTAYKMCDGRFEEGNGTMFLAGNDQNAKKIVSDIAKAWNWDVVDMGSIEEAYLLESIAMAWITYGFRNNHWTHGWKLMRK